MNVAILGDCGRLPIFINNYVSCIKHWVKLTRMEDDRLPQGSLKHVKHIS